ncbi:MAG: hypothetical protein H7834_16170 [Magnetococcus sp. YQC-9]
MTNTTDPDHMSTEARLSEIGAILATAIKRLEEKRKTEKIPVDKFGNQCPYAQKTTTGERA